MATYHRIVLRRWADSAFTGEGARLHGGRWNPPGIPAVYLADSRALAALEILVHAPREALALDWAILSAEVPAELIDRTTPADLPVDWRAFPSSPGARRLGAAWLRSRQRPALVLPSVILPEETILMLNPLHPDASSITVGSPRPFHFDPRFFPDKPAS